MAGMLVGARLVYAIVYEPGHYLDDPLEFFRLWHGGLTRGMMTKRSSLFGGPTLHCTEMPD